MVRIVWKRGNWCIGLHLKEAWTFAHKYAMAELCLGPVSLWCRLWRINR